MSKKKNHCQNINRQRKNEEDPERKKVLLKRFLPAPQQGKLVEQLHVSSPGVFWVCSVWGEQPEKGKILNS